MRIRLTKTGTVVDFCDGYAARLIEQGQAVPVPAAVPEAAAQAPAKGPEAASRRPAGERKVRGRGKDAADGTEKPHSK